MHGASLLVNAETLCTCRMLRLQPVDVSAKRESSWEKRHAGHGESVWSILDVQPSAEETEPEAVIQQLNETI